MKIIWSEEAKITYEFIIDDLILNWPIKIALEFENRTNILLSNLKENISLCPPTKYKNLRKCVIHKNVSLIYRFTTKKLEIITFIYNKDNHSFY